jgi:hypothetical protein
MAESELSLMQSLFSEGYVTETWIKHSLPYTAEVKNDFTYTSQYSKNFMLEFFFIHRLSQEEMSMLCALIISVILRKNMYKYMCFISKGFQYWAIWL